MAGSAIIGALRVVIGADSAALDKGLSEAQSSVAAFAKSFAASFAATASFGAISAKMKGIIDDMQELGRSAQVAGLPVEKLSALKYAAEQSEVSFESLTGGLNKLNKAMVAVAGGGGEKAAAAFTALGISVKDNYGNLKTNEEVLLEVADRFKGYEDGAAKAAIAQAIFGKSGAQLIPLLNEGSASIKELTAEAQRLGIVVDAETAASAKRFNDQIHQLEASFKGMSMTIVKDALPALNSFVETLAKFAVVQKDTVDPGDKEGPRSWFGSIKDALNELNAVMIGGAIIWSNFANVMSAWWTVIKAIASGDFAAAAEGVKRMDEAAAAALISFKNLGETVRQAMHDMETHSVKTGEAVKKTAAPIIQATNQTKDAFQTFLDGLVKQNAGLQGTVDAYGQVGLAADRLKIYYQGLAVAQQNGMVLSEKQKAQLYGLADAHAKLAFAAKLAKEAEADRAPFDQFSTQMQDLNLLLAQGTISWSLYEKGVEMAKRKLVETDPYITGLASNLTSAFDAAIEGGKTFHEIAQQLLKDLAKMVANTAFKQLLTGGQGSGGGILGSIFGALGGVKLPGAATGGSFTVGGAGGIDSQLAAFRVTPGEQVNITKPGQSSGGGMQFVYAPNIDARGADAAAVTRLAQSQQEMANTLRPTIRDEFNRYRQSTPGAFR